MAQNTAITVPAATWTLLTNSDITSITFQNQGSNYALIKATTDTTTPTDFTGAIRYNPGQGERNVAMTDLFPGLTGADRLWAWAPDTVSVFVSHG